MYPSDELTRLALKKHLLVVKSTVLRAQCVAAIQHLSAPYYYDSGMDWTLKKVFPYLRFASSFFNFGKKASRGGIWELIQKWTSILLPAFKWFRSATAHVDVLDDRNASRVSLKAGDGVWLLSGLAVGMKRG